MKTDGFILHEVFSLDTDSSSCVILQEFFSLETDSFILRDVFSLETDDLSCVKSSA